AAAAQAERLVVGLGDSIAQANTELLAAGSRLLYRGWNKEDADRCKAAAESLSRTSASAGSAYDRIVLAYVHVMRGRYEDALTVADETMSRGGDPADPMIHLFAVGAKTLALLHQGRWGELVSILHSGKEAARKNGSHPWLFAFREAWLRTAAHDFVGARTL